MSVTIGLISDVHAAAVPLQAALDIFQREGVETILCAGDTVGYGADKEQTVQLLLDCRCQNLLGNHDLWYLDSVGEESTDRVAAYLRSLPTKIELNVVGKTIYMVHASPPDSNMEGIRLLDEKGALIDDERRRWTEALKPVSFDLLLVGHTHQVFAEALGDVLVVNPGSTLFNHTCAILTLPSMEVELFSLEGKKPLLAWNWGMGLPPG